MNILEKKTFKTGEYSNAAALVLFDDSKGVRRMLCIKEKRTNVFNIPGGKADKTDKDSLHTALREMQEETKNGRNSGIVLKDIQHVGAYNIRGSIIHVIMTSDSLDKHCTSNVTNNETDFIGAFRVDYIQKLVNNNDSLDKVTCYGVDAAVRGCCKNTFNKMFKK